MGSGETLDPHATGLFTVLLEMGDELCAVNAPRAVADPKTQSYQGMLHDKRLQMPLFASSSARLASGVFCQIMLLFASQTAQGGPSVILPALLITGLLVAASQAFVPKGDDQN